MNDFIIKSSLVELERLGYDIVECSRIFDDNGSVAGCVFKFKYDNLCFYSKCYYKGSEDFSFEDYVLKPIDRIIADYSNNSFTHNEFVHFISTQCFNIANFKYRENVYFYTAKADSFFGKCAIEYANKREFMFAIDNINLDDIICFDP